MRQEATVVFQAGSTLPETRPEFPYQQVDIPREDGVRQFGWIVEQPDHQPRPWVVYLHGNASNLASAVNISHYRLLRRVGVNVLAPEYQGFGGLDGDPSEAALQQDAASAYAYLRKSRGVPPSQAAIYGWSLGSAIGVDLAAREQVGALVLEGAPASLLDITQRRYPLFPVRLLMRSAFESAHTIKGVTAPVLFLHSVQDQVIPVREGRRLYDATTAEKKFVELRGGHFTVTNTDAGRMAEAIADFLTSHGLKPIPPRE
jgi:pimeloyl-ACP methyl ester carboxylesterase